MLNLYIFPVNNYIFKLCEKYEQLLDFLVLKYFLIFLILLLWYETKFFLNLPKFFLLKFVYIILKFVLYFQKINQKINNHNFLDFLKFFHLNLNLYH